MTGLENPLPEEKRGPVRAPRDVTGWRGPECAQRATTRACGGHLTEVAEREGCPCWRFVAIDRHRLSACVRPLRRMIPAVPDVSIVC